MKKKCILYLVSTLISLSLAAKPAINPQIGANANFIWQDLNGISHNPSAGFQLGGQVVLGKTLYFAPGIYWQNSRSDFRIADLSIEDDITVDMLHIPFLGGVKLIPGNIFNVRLYSGMSLSLPIQVKDNTFGVKKDDFSFAIWGWPLGIGIDIAMFTFDINYEIGFTRLYHFKLNENDLSAKADVLKLNFGIRF